MKKIIKKIFNEKNIAIYVFLALIASIIYILVRMVLAPSTPESGLPVKSTYTLSLIQCILGVVAMFLPSVISKRFKVQIPNNMIILYVIFLYAAIILGEVSNFYYNIQNWDTILHTFSGAMIGALGFSVISLLNSSDRIESIKLSPIFVALFSFCFAVSVGVAWEIYEYSFDSLLGLNMQKFVTYQGTVLVGQAALADTMKDLIVDSVGAFAMASIGYISLKYKKGWIEKFLLKRVRSVNVERIKSGKKLTK
ncbi:MAG: hypothetical protein RSE57_01215 [Clostridia bacterium]